MVTGVRVNPGGGGGGVPPLSEQARTSAAAAAARARGRRIMVVFYCRFPSEVRMASLNVPMYDPAMVRPIKLYTVFAGQDAEATARARSYFTGYGPSSPSMALFRDGRLVYMLERRSIEGRSPRDIAADLVAAFDRFCA